MCQRVIIIDNGSIVADKRVDQLKNESGEFGGYETIKVSFEDKVTKDQLNEIDGVFEVKDGPGGSFLLLAPEKHKIRAEIFHYAVEQNWTMIEMTEESDSLEQIFKNLTGKGGQGD